MKLKRTGTKINSHSVLITCAIISITYTSRNPFCKTSVHVSYSSSMNYRHISTHCVHLCEEHATHQNLSRINHRHLTPVNHSVSHPALTGLTNRVIIEEYQVKQPVRKQGRVGVCGITCALQSDLQMRRARVNVGNFAHPEMILGVLGAASTVKGRHPYGVPGSQGLAALWESWEGRGGAHAFLW